MQRAMSNEAVLKIKREYILPAIKTYYKVSVIKMACCWLSIHE